MSECLLYYLKEGETRIGRGDSSIVQDIILLGTHIMSEHCVIENILNETVILKPISNSSLCYVNGKKIDESFVLKTGDRVIFGRSHVFRYNNPEQARKEKKTSSTNEPVVNESIDSVDWVIATEELLEKQGIDIKQEMERLLAFEEQYKREVETNKLNKEKLIEYESKISDLEKQVDNMTKSMLSSAFSSSCIAGGVGQFDNESSTMSMTANDDEIMTSSSLNIWTEREYRLALWGWKRWKLHQMTSLRVSFHFENKII
jgi:kinesin family protein 1